MHVLPHYSLINVEIKVEKAIAKTAPIIMLHRPARSSSVVENSGGPVWSAISDLNQFAYLLQEMVIINFLFRLCDFSI